MWECIHSNDLDGLYSLFANVIASPTDQDDQGQNPLHVRHLSSKSSSSRTTILRTKMSNLSTVSYAAQYCNIPVCRVLLRVQRGADLTRVTAYISYPRMSVKESGLIGTVVEKVHCLILISCFSVIIFGCHMCYMCNLVCPLVDEVFEVFRALKSAGCDPEDCQIDIRSLAEHRNRHGPLLDISMRYGNGQASSAAVD